MSPNGAGKPDVFIVGVGMTPVGEHWDRSLRQLASEAIESARDDAGGLRPQAVYVANMLAASLSGQTQLGALVADFAGLRGVEAATFEAAGASGGVALRQAFLAVSAGLADVVLVVGVEKVTDKVGSSVDAALAMSTDADHEAVQGVTPSAQAALLMRRYLHEHRIPADALAGFSLTAHANAVANPCAIYRRAITAEEYAQAPMMCDPVNMYDAAPMADGAAALVVARGEVLPQADPSRAVRILASTVSTSAVAVHDQADLLLLEAAAQSAAQAYEQAGIGPEAIDLFELHDLFSIYAALSLEAGGFARRGHAWELARDGQISRAGRLPILTFGGSKARGDTGGATGIYQAAEVARQLQGRAGEAQVAKPLMGMAQCLGGAGATASTHILGRLGAW